MFSDETLVSQFYAFCRHVRRPFKQRDNPCYIVPTVKNASKVMIWAAICAGGRSGLWFMPEDTSIIGTVYLEVLKSKVPSFMEIKRCSHFQHDGAPCYQTKAVKKWFGEAGIEILKPWPGNSPDLNPIENCWVFLKQKVAAHNPISLSDLKQTIKQVWMNEISVNYCKNCAYLCLKELVMSLKTKVDTPNIKSILLNTVHL